MSVRKVADLQEEEIEECEPLWSKNYSQEYLYVKMRFSQNSPDVTNRQRGSRWPTLEQLRPKLKRASLLETSLEDDQLLPKSDVATVTSATSTFSSSSSSTCIHNRVEHPPKKKPVASQGEQNKRPSFFHSLNDFAKQILFPTFTYYFLHYFSHLVLFS